MALGAGIRRGIFFGGPKPPTYKIVCSVSKVKDGTTKPRELLKHGKGGKKEGEEGGSAPKEEAPKEEEPAKTEEPKDEAAPAEGGAEADFDIEKEAKDLKADEGNVDKAEEAKKAQTDAAAALLASESAGQAEKDKIVDSLAS